MSRSGIEISDETGVQRQPPYPLNAGRKVRPAEPKVYIMAKPQVVRPILLSTHQLSLEYQEPPIRGKFLARAKRESYEKGKKFKLAA